jgi:hypothetical protein
MNEPYGCTWCGKRICPAPLRICAGCQSEYDDRAATMPACARDGNNKSRSRFTPADVADMRLMRDQGATLEAIGNKYHTSYQSIRRCLASGGDRS